MHVPLVLLNAITLLGCDLSTCLRSCDCCWPLRLTWGDWNRIDVRCFDCGTEMKSDVINWDLCVYVCVRLNARKKEHYEAGLHTNFLLHHLISFDCFIWTPYKQYILWHKKVGWSLTSSNLHGWSDSMGNGLKRDTSLQYIYWMGRGFLACGARKKQEGFFHVATESLLK